MIEPVQWRLLAGKRPPFGSKVERERLALTVHCPDAATLSTRVPRALDLIRELAWIDAIDIVDTKEGAAHHMAFGEYDPERRLTPVTIRGPKGVTSTGVWGAEQWVRSANHLGGANAQFAADILVQMPVLEAHQQGYRHILATNNETLLRLRQCVPGANIRSIDEATKILGLYLRSCGDFTYQASQLGPKSFDRGLFYWVLCRHRLPAMWKYFSACVQRARALQDKTDYLGNSVLDRCTRALQARDEVGFQFYAPQDNSTRDAMLYHFDYLTLLLTGAIDAQARVAHRAYETRRIKVRNASFRNSDFLRALQAAGASMLVAVAASDEFVSFAEVLWTLRNTIHGTGLRGLGSSRRGEPEGSLVRVLHDEADRVWEASGRLGSREDLGVTDVIGVEIEPYTCAVQLTELGFRFINQVAEATDITRLLSPGLPLGDLRTAPPEDEIFGVDTRTRIDALG